MAEEKVEPSACIDWAKCILCQEKKKEALQCPGNTLRGDVEYGSGYHTLANNILRFNELGCLPIPLEIGKLNEGDGIAATFVKRNAKWHKTCNNKFNNLKLQRAEKRKSLDKPDCHLPTKLTRSSSGARTLNVRSCCFFCDHASGTLHQASTFNMDARVRKCAIQLQERVLLTKLSAGDLISQEAVYRSNCLVTLYNKAQRFSENTEGEEEKLHQGIALAQFSCLYRGNSSRIS